MDEASLHLKGALQSAAAGVSAEDPIKHLRAQPTDIWAHLSLKVRDAIVKHGNKKLQQMET